MSKISQLFLSFARIGALTFGGGYAMIPMLEKELVEKRHWVSEEEILDYYAVGQCTPGIIAVNVATFVGRKIGGFWGGIAATLGIAFPSFLIISIIASVLTNFAELQIVKSAFAGIRVCVCVLIFNSVLKLYKKAVKDKWALILFVLVFGLSVFADISPIVFVLICGLSGIILTNLGVRDK